MTPIEKNIIVVDEYGKEYEATYSKRAKGLVKKGRARFISENKICIACPPNKFLEDNNMIDKSNNAGKQSSETPENSNNLSDTIKIKAETSQKNDKLSMKYVLEQIEKIVSQTDYLNNAIEKLGKMSDGDNAEAYSPGNTLGQAKAAALGDAIRSRETTNQQLLKFYEKIYDDIRALIKPQSSIVSHFDELTNWLKTVNWDELPAGSQTLIGNAVTHQLSRHW